jgi:hypothetical protein
VQQDSYLGAAGDPASQNLFAYGNNNPALFTDPSGHLPVLIPAAFLWALPYLGAAAVLYCLTSPYCRDTMAELTVAAWRGTEQCQQAATDQLRRIITQQSGSGPANNLTTRPFRELQADAEAATGKRAKGGTSLQEILVNVKTGERIVRHTVLSPSGRVLEEHFRPYYKPRGGEVE